MLTEAELSDIERFSVSAWYYPGTKPEGNRDAKADIASLIAEVRRLKDLVYCQIPNEIFQQAKQGKG